MEDDISTSNQTYGSLEEFLVSSSLESFRSKIRRVIKAQVVCGENLDKAFSSFVSQPSLYPFFR